MLGDPTPSSCEVSSALIADGADALEQVPAMIRSQTVFVIQEAPAGAQAGTAIGAFGSPRIVTPPVSRYPLKLHRVPFSIGVDRFYELCAQAVDSVLIGLRSPRGIIREAAPSRGSGVYCSPIGLAPHAERRRAFLHGTSADLAWA